MTDENNFSQKSNTASLSSQVHNVIKNCTAGIASEFVKWVVNNFGSEINYTVFVALMSTVLNWIGIGLYKVAKHFNLNLPSCRFRINPRRGANDIIELINDDNSRPHLPIHQFGVYSDHRVNDVIEIVNETSTRPNRVNPPHLLNDSLSTNYGTPVSIRSRDSPA